MSKISLGAINKHTGKYVYPKIANKEDEYICPECNKDVILYQDEIINNYFHHKLDTNNSCHYYSSPNNTQIYTDVNMLMKTLLENKNSINIVRECASCKINKRNSENEELPFEIYAETFIKVVNDNKRNVLCMSCIIYENSKDDKQFCYVCGGRGESYWSDGCYGSCLECCCITCGKFDDKCECKYCEKCENYYRKDEEHECYLCDKCGSYTEYDIFVNYHNKYCKISE